MADRGHMAHPRAHHHGHADEAALGEHHVGLDFSHQRDAFRRPGDDLEGVGKILQTEIAAQLAAFHRVIGNARNGGDHLMLDAVLRADVMDFIPCFLQPGDQAQVRGHVPRCAAAGQYDPLYHGTTSVSVIRISVYHTNARDATPAAEGSADSLQFGVQTAQDSLFQP